MTGCDNKTLCGTCFFFRQLDPWAGWCGKWNKRVWGVCWCERFASKEV